VVLHTAVMLDKPGNLCTSKLT